MELTNEKEIIITDFERIETTDISPTIGDCDPNTADCTNLCTSENCIVCLEVGVSLTLNFYCIYCPGCADCGEGLGVPSNTENFSFGESDVIEKCPEYSHIKWQKTYSITEGSGTIWIQLNLETNTWAWGGTGVVLFMAGTGNCSEGVCAPGVGSWPDCDAFCECFGASPNPCIGQTPPLIDSCDYHEENICCEFNAAAMLPTVVIDAPGATTR